MAAKYILAHDLGTTGNKATLFDERGLVRASSFAGYGTEYPRPNWVEQDPKDWWHSVCLTTRQLVQESGIQKDEIACVSFSGQMMGCVALDHQARPLCSALIWADTRAVSQAEQLIERVGMERAYRISGHRLSPSYSVEKMMWIREYQPDVFRQTYKFVQVKDFIVARLTGVFATDYSDASGTNVYDLRTYDWSDEMMEAAELDRAVLPELHAATDVIGTVLPSIAEEAGLKPGTPVVIGGGDGSCASAGAGVVQEGSAYNNLGTSSWIAIASREPIFDPTLRTFTFAHLMRGMYSPMGTMQAAGGCYQWVRDIFCQAEVDAAEKMNISPYELMNQLAEQSVPGAHGITFFPYLLGERSPRWNPDARGVYFGLSMGHTRADILRATLEGITFNLRAILDTLTQQGARIPAMRVIGGGAKGRLWRQIMADIYQIPVQRPSLLAEATSFGAALAGGIGIGLYPGWELAEQLTPIIDEVQPDPAVTELYNQRYAFFNQAYESFVPLYSQLAAL